MYIHTYMHACMYLKRIEGHDSRLIMTLAENGFQVPNLLAPPPQVRFPSRV
jgi:hypothetical protein